MGTGAQMFSVNEPSPHLLGHFPGLMFFITQNGLLIFQYSNMEPPSRATTPRVASLVGLRPKNRQSQAEGCGKAQPQCQGGKAPSGFGFQRLGSQCLKQAGPSGIKGGIQAEPQKGQAESLVQD